METTKYYTPSIEEFHLGFECELQDVAPPENNWHPHVISEYDTFLLLDKWNKAGDIRVKILDRSDIESLGWKQEDYDNFSLNNRVLEFNPEHKTFIYESRGSKRIMFGGKIKNKSELKKLMSQLNIY